MRESRKLSFFGGEASGVYEVKDAEAVRCGKFTIGREEVKRIGKAARANAKITYGNGASEASGVYEVEDAAAVRGGKTANYCVRRKFSAAKAHTRHGQGDEGMGVKGCCSEGARIRKENEKRANEYKKFKKSVIFA